MITIEARLDHWANNIHEQCACLTASRYLVFESRAMESLDMGTTKLRECAMKAMDTAASVGRFLNKLLGYSLEASEWVEKDPVVYAITMATYLAIRKILMIFSNGKFKSNDKY